jgi:hypothetical protein
MVLLARGVIRRGTTIEAPQKVRGLSCIRNETILRPFVITGVRRHGLDRIVFEAIDADQTRCVVEADDVVRLDGMLVNRITLAQNLTEEGVELPSRSRRGRRKKAVDDAPACAHLPKVAALAKVGANPATEGAD